MNKDEKHRFDTKFKRMAAEEASKQVAETLKSLNKMSAADRQREGMKILRDSSMVGDTGMKVGVSREEEEEELEILFEKVKTEGALQELDSSMEICMSRAKDYDDRVKCRGASEVAVFKALGYDENDKKIVKDGQRTAAFKAEYLKLQEKAAQQKAATAMRIKSE